LEIRSLLQCRSLKREFWQMWYNHKVINSEEIQMGNLFFVDLQGFKDNHDFVADCCRYSENI
jgi:hypothetical protein